jgi:hypothetical protein
MCVSKEDKVVKGQNVKCIKWDIAFIVDIF